MEYNDQQLEAINSNDRTILCLAGAGAGKSSVLVKRIDRLIKEGANPNSILALTFTNAAAFEMGEKFKRLQKTKLNASPEFRTFHGFCYSLIVKDKELRTKLGYAQIPQICDDAQFRRVDKEMRIRLNFDISEKKIASNNLTRKEQYQLELYNKAVKKELLLRNLITFDIMCYDVCELFCNDDPIVAKYKLQYRYIFVDEMQDTDQRQFKFAASFPADTSIFFVADALQNIYQFRGCTNEYVKALASAPNWKVIKLYKNYRSTRQICDYANKFSHYAKPEYRIEMEGQRDGDRVEVVYDANASFSIPVDEHHMQDVIERLKASKEETAILCRSNKEVNYIKSVLEARGIACISNTKSSEARYILDSALSTPYFVDWLLSCLDETAYNDYIRLCNINPETSGRDFINQYRNHPSIGKKIEKVIKVRTITISNASFEDKFTQICKLLRIKSKCKFDDSVQYTNRILIKNIRDQLEEITESDLYVGTIHSSKGLEYDRVFVMGVDDKSFPLGSEEMNNLFYVAITRAKEHLVVYRA